MPTPILRVEFVTQAFRMHPPSLPQLAALDALGNWTALALNLEELTVGVITGRSPVTFDTRLADKQFFRQ